MAGEISENSPAAVKEASVELPAPDGWKKKFTPKKGGTPRRNVIVFISPTGEEITNKKQLDQYIRAHPEGPSSSEFDWGTGDTPRRSARLGGKAKPTESPEGEKPTKKERKSSGKKGKADKKDIEDGENESLKAAESPEGEKPTKKERKSSGKKGKADKKDTEDGENESLKAAEDAAAAESTDVEMKDAGGDADEAGKVHTEGNADKAEGEEVSKTVEEDGKEAEKGNQEKEVSKTVEEDGKEAEEVNQEKEVSMTLEGKEDENADKEMEDSEMLILTSEVKENADKEKLEDSVALAQTQRIEKESEDADKKTEDTDALLPAYEGKENEDTEIDGESKASETAEDAAASVEAQESTDVEMNDAGGNADKAGEVHTEGNVDEAEGEAQKASVEKTNENDEHETQGPQENEISVPVQANQGKEASEIVEGKEDENADKGKEDENADKEMEDAEMLIPISEVKENENADNDVALAQTQHIEKENENADNKSEDFDIFFPASEGKEEEYTEKDGRNEAPKTEEYATAADEAQESTELEMKGTEGNADKAEGAVEKTTEGQQVNESSGPVVEDGKEAENANQGEENEVADKMTEGSDILLPASEGKEEDREKEKPEALPQPQHAVSCNDGPHQRKSSPVNC